MRFAVPRIANGSWPTSRRTGNGCGTSTGIASGRTPFGGGAGKARRRLRVVDCNDESCRAVARDAPKMVDHLCGSCREHYDGVLAALDDEGLIHHQVDTLVRGLDYYVRTAFEYVSPVLPEGQASMGGGGRDAGSHGGRG